METSRRTILSAALITGSAALVGNATLLDARATAATPKIAVDPFTLGVASGDPAPDGFVIWTRLAPSPLEDDGLGGMPARPYQVGWQVASDERFTDVVRAGSVAAGPESAHAVHVEVTGLSPGREYYYRFRVGRWLSGSGRG